MNKEEFENLLTELEITGGAEELYEHCEERREFGGWKFSLVESNFDYYDEEVLYNTQVCKMEKGDDSVYFQFETQEDSYEGLSINPSAEITLVEPKEVMVTKYFPLTSHPVIE